MTYVSAHLLISLCFKFPSLNCGVIFLHVTCHIIMLPVTTFSPSCSALLLMFPLNFMSNLRVNGDGCSVRDVSSMNGPSGLSESG